MIEHLILQRLITYGIKTLSKNIAPARFLKNLVFQDDLNSILGSKSEVNNKSMQESGDSTSSNTGTNKLPEGNKIPHKVYRIVLTGGPCSGKTTGVKFIAEELRKRGISAYTVPESATIIADGGGFINSLKLNKEGQIKLQSVISQLTLDLEDRFYQLACDDGSLAIMLCDRGIMDGKAYCENDAWETLIKQKGWAIDDMRDKRYDAVLHLATTAEGCVTKYSNFNNRVRFETVEEALLVDKKLQEAWNSHPSFFILDNKYDFEHKMNDAFGIVWKIIAGNNLKFNK